MIDTRHTEAELRWRASPLTRSVATCAGVALVAALIGSRWQLIAFVAPLLGVLCSIGWQRTVPRIYLHAEPGLQRCFEGEQTQLTVWATAEPGDVAVELAISGVDGMQLDVLGGGLRERQTVAVDAERWGRYPIRARVDVVAPGGLLAGTATVDATLPHLTSAVRSMVELQQVTGMRPGELCIMRPLRHRPWRRSRPATRSTRRSWPRWPAAAR